MESKDRIVPEQHEGTKKNTSHVVKLDSVTQAEALFLDAKERLLDINHWKEYAGKGTADFALIDDSGNILSGIPVQGNYIRIDIPAPGTKAGDGYDWVQIKEIEEYNSEDEQTDRIALLVHPANNPEKPLEDTAHFFKTEASSSFIIERKGNAVSAYVLGRNESPNTKEVNNPLDKLRNMVVSVTAMLGFSDIQWKQLVKGLLEYEIEKGKD